MVYFAEIDDDKIVTRVVVVSDEHDNEDGCDWCEQFFGPGTWVRTAMDGSIRKNYAGPGYSYDAVNDGFVAPKLFPSWTLDTDTFRWEPPVARVEGVVSHWDEASLSWVAD